MVLTNLTVTNFRSYDEKNVVFDPRMTFITGKNGSGKTNLLEAIYMVFHGSSFRGHDAAMLRHGTEWWKVSSLVDGAERELRYQLHHSPPKQLIMHDTKKRFTYRERLPVVLFEPNDLLVIHGSPSRRRDMVDVMTKSLIPGHQQLMAKYERALRQRAALLKRYTHDAGLRDMLFVWDVALSELGARIIENRRSCVDRINTGLSEYYSQLAGASHLIHITYESQFSGGDIHTKLLAALHKNIAIDTQRHTTSVGPHRDDIGISIDDTPVRDVASRGEIRSIVLALKATYSRAVAAVYKTSPILLLDDVYSELDTDRQKQLAQLFTEQQLIISDTKSHTGGRTIRL